MTVDVLRLSSITVSGRQCAAIAPRRGEGAKQIATFCCLGQVKWSSLRARIDIRSPEKELHVRFPTLVLDRLQTCLSVAFDLWDTILMSPISCHGVTLRTGRKGPYLPYSQHKLTRC